MPKKKKFSPVLSHVCFFGRVFRIVKKNRCPVETRNLQNLNLEEFSVEKITRTFVILLADRDSLSSSLQFQKSQEVQIHILFNPELVGREEVRGKLG